MIYVPLDLSRRERERWREALYGDVCVGEGAKGDDDPRRGAAFYAALFYFFSLVAIASSVISRAQILTAPADVSRVPLFILKKKM